jgi:hypothetical protein
MRRVITLVLVVACASALLSGASWALAQSTVASLLGAPPPRMGHSDTQFSFDGVRQVRHHPRAWIFTYGPTAIPGASRVRIYVGPMGRLLRTEPADLAARMKTFHATGY